MKKRALRHTNNRDPRDRGFTLLELMVTVAILVILLAIGAPQLQNFLARRTVSTQADIFASALRTARSEAIKRSVPVVICASNNSNDASRSCATNSQDWSTGWFLFVDSDNNGLFDNTKEQVLSVQPAFLASGGIKLANSLASIKFANNGLPQGFSNKTFSVILKGASNDLSPLNLCVVIATSGRVKVMSADKTTGGC